MWWHDLTVAFCLVLIIEGLLPFLSPGRWRRLLILVDQVDDATVRLFGLGCMLAGTALLLLVN